MRRRRAGVCVGCWRHVPLPEKDSEVPRKVAVPLRNARGAKALRVPSAVRAPGMPPSGAAGRGAAPPPEFTPPPPPGLDESLARWGFPHGSVLLFSQLGAGESGRLPGDLAKLLCFRGLA